MSFRAELREALNDVVPTRPTPGMRERVLQTTLAHKRRQRKERMVYQMRFPLALVAAVLLVAVAAAGLMTWNALHNNVAPVGPVNVTPLQQLEARPLVMPRASSQQTCTDHPGVNRLGFQYGDGPVYGNGGWETSTSWGYFYDVTYYVPATVPGPILLRGEDLISGKAMVFVGPKTEGTIVGPAVGTDPSQSPSTLRTEFVIDPSNPPRTFFVRQGLPKDYVGCFGIQMDGPTFTEWVSQWGAP
ncbi:MAG TPA: hypothetical protein VGX22_05490 [Candidatus Dormibacteraeota bacterium]|nr:hypothetical protein [Candidatus Dormibacteraeota bacterium]